MPQTQVVSLLLILLLMGCEPAPSRSSNRESSPPPPAITVETADIDLQYHRDVAYGEHTRQRLDLFQPVQDDPTALIIFIHGGRFMVGDKADFPQSDAIEILNRGIAYASLNYRLLQSVDEDGVIKPLSDSMRALQYIRYHADSFNIDPARIAIYGHSAGAGTALWLALSDDMAEPASIDPIAQQSTRLTAAAATETQATYDIKRWESDVFLSFGLTINMVVALSPSYEQTLLSFYGIDNLAELDNDDITDYRARVDMLALMSADDAPLWIENREETDSFPSSAAKMFHHPYHALILQQQAELIGLSAVVNIPQMNIYDASEEPMVDFLIRHVQMQ